MAAANRSPTVGTIETHGETIRTVGWRGLALQLTGPDDLVDAVGRQLPDFWTTGDTPTLGTAPLTQAGEWCAVDLPDDLGYRGPAGPGSERAVASRIELFLVSRLTDVAPVHAGVVAVDGRAIVLPGSSMAGKSTLVRALLELGATYLSDEFALITPEGTVAPYPRKINIRTPAGTDCVAPARRADPTDHPVPIAVIASFVWSAAEVNTHDQSAAQAVLDLVANSVTVRQQPELAMSAFSAAAQRARCIAGRRGEAAVAAAELITLAPS